jgi:hypothetical protein
MDKIVAENPTGFLDFLGLEQMFRNWERNQIGSPVHVESNGDRFAQGSLGMMDASALRPEAVSIVDFVWRDT